MKKLIVLNLTQTTAATAEESAAASEVLNSQAEQSLGVVARLEALVGATQATPGAPTPRAQAPGQSAGEGLMHADRLAA